MVDLSSSAITNNSSIARVPFLAILMQHFFVSLDIPSWEYASSCRPQPLLDVTGLSFPQDAILWWLCCLLFPGKKYWRSTYARQVEKQPVPSVSGIHPLNMPSKSSYEEDHINWPLHNACKHGQLETVVSLLSAGADVNWRDGWALSEAAINNKIKVVTILLRAGADVHLNDDFALVGASERGFVDVVTALLVAGADVHADGDSALRKASKKGHAITAKVLLKYGADVHAWNEDSMFSAAYEGHVETLKVLLENGANVNEGDGEILVGAARSGNTEIVKVLLKAGIDPSAHDNEALSAASYLGHANMVNVLVGSGNECAKRGCGWALQIALKHNDAVIVNILSEYMEKNQADDALEKATICSSTHRRVW